MLEIDRLTLAYGDEAVVRDVSLTAGDGEVLCLLGPSGCGKSTLLRAVAGLHTPVSGSIRLHGRDLAQLRPDQRDVGLMFQEHALFPHRTVAENVAFGPRMHGLAAEQTAERVRDTLALVGLRGTEHRRIDELSGGERQRVALARAVAPRPRLLMLDEPLGSLDRSLQTRLLDELPEVFTELGTTVVYVTHDQHEALSLAERIVIMRAGGIEQVGTPTDLWRGPANDFVARFLGLEHLFDVEVGSGTARTPFGPVPAAGRADGPATVVLLPGSLRLTDPRTPLRDDELPIAARVVRHRFAGDHVRLEVETPAGEFLRIPVFSGGTPPDRRVVEVALDLTALRILDRAPAAPDGPASRRGAGPEQARQ